MSVSEALLAVGDDVCGVDGVFSVVVSVLVVCPSRVCG